MVFADLIATILKQQGITAKQLGLEIGVTGATISNLATGRVLKPEGKTCQLLLGYCKAHNIDTSGLDWNKIIRNYFDRSRYKKEYEWYSDVDETGTFRLRHLKCGKITSVPIMSLDGVSMPCIHCWTNAYMALDAYAIKLKTDSTEYPITHTWCGHKYIVSYEQIKQKKYLCPVCFRDHKSETEAASYGRRQDYRFLTNPEYIVPIRSTANDPVDDEPDELIDDDTPLDELSLDDFLLSFEKKPKRVSTQDDKSKRDAQEKQEADHRERERLDAERRERERLEVERREQARLDAERRERERLEAERRKQAHLEAERRERERLEVERQERERIEAERKERRNRIEQLVRTLKVVHSIKIVEAETQKKLQAQLIACLDSIRTKKEKAEAELLRQAQIERERIEAEQREHERIEAERREQERLEAERREREHLEAERREKMLDELRSIHDDTVRKLQQQYMMESEAINKELQFVSRRITEVSIQLSQLSFLRFFEKRNLKSERDNLILKQNELRSELSALESTFNAQIAQETERYEESVRVL